MSTRGSSASRPSSSNKKLSAKEKERQAQLAKERAEAEAAAASDRPPSPDEAPMEEGIPPVNYVDVKLHGIFNVPQSWTVDSGTGPLFNDHAFRYEVDVSAGGSRHTFASGRLLQQFDPYVEFIERTQLPPPVPEVDPDDQPEYTDPRRVAKTTFKDVPEDVSEALPPPPIPSVTVRKDSAISSMNATGGQQQPGTGRSDSTTGKGGVPSINVSKGGAAGSVKNDSSRNNKSGPDSSTRAGVAGGNKSSRAAAGNNNKDDDDQSEPPAPLGIYWVLSSEHDNDLKEDLALKAKEAKANKNPKKGEVVQTVEVKPPQPSSNPPLCVARLPLGPKQLAKFESHIEQGIPLTFTFRRVLRSTCPAEWGEDAQEQKFQAKIRMNLKALQKPGSLKMTNVEVPLEPILPEVPVDDKSHMKGGKRGGAANAATKKAKGNSPALLMEDPFLDPADGTHPYTSNKVHARISIECFSPITRLPSTRLKPAVDPCDLIPRRVRPAHRQADATKIFADSIEQLMLRIIRDHREHKGAIIQQIQSHLQAQQQPQDTSQQTTSSSSNDPSSIASSMIPQEELRQTFLSMLHSTGKIHTYKELLVPAVEQVVRETFLRQPKPSNSDLERSASELYSYLMDHVHLKLNDLFSTSGTKKIAGAENNTSIANSSSAANTSNTGSNNEDPATRWARLAKEAEIMGDNEKATKYWQQRLVCGWSGVDNNNSTDSSSSPEKNKLQATVAAWNDFAEYCLRCRDVIKAEQGYKEAISIDSTYVPALTGYGTLLLTRSRFVEAEVFLQAAVDLQPSTVTWGLLAMYFDALLLSLPNSPEEAERLASCKREAKYALTQAIKAIPENESKNNNISNASKSPPLDASLTDEELQEKAENEALAGQIKVYHRLASYLLELHHEDLVNICLSRVPPSTEVDLLYANLFSQTRQFDDSHSLAEKLRNDTTQLLNSQMEQQKQLNNQLQIAHRQAELGQSTNNKTTSEAAEHQNNNNATIAGAASSTISTTTETPETVKLSTQLSELQLAMNSCRRIIAQTHVLQGDLSTLQNNFAESERHYELAVRFESDIFIGSGSSSSSASSSSTLGLVVKGEHYVRLGNSYIRLGKYKDALTSFSNAVKLWPCGLTWLGVGISYYRMDDLARAELALNEANILNNLCTRTWSFLSLVCFRQRREADGDQAFNQAIKLGLADSALLSEIGAEQARLGRYPVAEACFRRALAINADDCNTRMQLAKVLLLMRKLSEARNEFVIVSKSSMNDVQRQKAEEQANGIGALLANE